MVLEHLVDRCHLLEAVLQRSPVRLDDLVRDESHHVLDEGEHPRSEGEDARLPSLKRCQAGATSPVVRRVLGPHHGELQFGVAELQEESEEDLVSGDGLPRDDERQREPNGVVELEGLESCIVASRTSRSVVSQCDKGRGFQCEVD